MEEGEARGASVEELRELLGKGRAKKGIFEGDLKEGELEIGQVASLFWEELSVEEVMKELIRDFKLSLENVKTQLCSWENTTVSVDKHNCVQEKTQLCSLS